MLVPAWLAITLTVPAPVMVNRFPESEAGPETRLKVTGLPEAPPVADKAIGATPKVTGVGGVKMIVWEIRLMTSV